MTIDHWANEQQWGHSLLLAHKSCFSSESSASSAVDSQADPEKPRRTQRTALLATLTHQYLTNRFKERRHYAIALRRRSALTVRAVPSTVDEPDARGR